MDMLGAGKNMQVPKELPSKPVFRKHPPDGILNDKLRLLNKHLFRSPEALSSRIARMPHILFTGKFIACENNLFRVNYNHIVTTINMGCEIWFVLPSEQFCYFAGQPSYCLISRIDDQPFLVYSCIICTDRLETQCIHSV